MTQGFEVLQLPEEEEAEVRVAAGIEAAVDIEPAASEPATEDMIAIGVNIAGTSPHILVDPLTIVLGIGQEMHRRTLHQFRNIVVLRLKGELFIPALGFRSGNNTLEHEEPREPGDIRLGETVLLVPGVNVHVAVKARLVAFREHLLPFSDRERFALEIDRQVIQVMCLLDFLAFNEGARAFENRLQLICRYRQCDAFRQLDAEMPHPVRRAEKAFRLKNGKKRVVGCARRDRLLDDEIGDRLCE